MSPVILIQENPEHRVIESLSGYLELAHAGQLRAFVLAGILKGQQYFTHRAGIAYDVPLIGLGLASLLAITTEGRVKHKAMDSMFGSL